MVAGDPISYRSVPRASSNPLVPRDAERLTGEAPAKQIVTGDVSRRNSRKVARRFLPKFSIGQAGVRIKIDEKTQACPSRQELAKPSDTAKEIYEPQLIHSRLH